MKQEMLINVAQPEECRIAIVEDGVLEELYTERSSQDNYVGNIYKGKIVNLEPSIQAAFVDFGVGRNGFLHISDVEPQYFRQGGYDPNRPIEPDGSQRPAGSNGSAESKRRERDEESSDADVPDDIEVDESEPRRPPRGRPRQRPGARPRIKPPIQQIFRRGDEVLVQVIKEGIGSKGPTLSTYISIPGRYLVLMPALGRVGVSRKIEDEEARRRLRDYLYELNPPKGLGFIVRTAGVERTRKELSRDLAYLVRLWKTIVRRIKSQPAPIDIYEESDMIIRTIRDIFTSEVDSIVIDEPAAYERAKEFLQIVMPRYVGRLQLYEGREPLFHKYGIAEEIMRINERVVPLRNGGSIVIDQTEALVAIDVNSGNFRTREGAEETAFQLNQTAAREIARQLRLRDLGGVIVNDFIDMRKERHRRGVENLLRDATKRDRARTKILRTSPFGLIEMTRQRIRPSLKRSVFQECPGCSGAGLVKTAETVAIEVMRKLMSICDQESVARVTFEVCPDVAEYLNNRKRREISRMEDESKLVVQIQAREGASPEHLVAKCEDDEGREVRVGGVTVEEERPARGGSRRGGGSRGGSSRGGGSRAGSSRGGSSRGGGSRGEASPSEGSPSEGSPSEGSRGEGSRGEGSRGEGSRGGSRGGRGRGGSRGSGRGSRSRGSGSRGRSSGSSSGGSEAAQTSSTESSPAEGSPAQNSPEPGGSAPPDTGPPRSAPAEGGSHGAEQGGSGAGGSTAPETGSPDTGASTGAGS